MRILDRIKDKIAPKEAPEKNVDPVEGYQIPVNVNEYLPWKGHVFKIKSVGKMEFTAECVGITNARAKDLGLVRK